MSAFFFYKSSSSGFRDGCLHNYESISILCPSLPSRVYHSDYSIPAAPHRVQHSSSMRVEGVRRTGVTSYVEDSNAPSGFYLPPLPFFPWFATGLLFQSCSPGFALRGHLIFKPQLLCTPKNFILGIKSRGLGDLQDLLDLLELNTAPLACFLWLLTV